MVICDERNVVELYCFVAHAEHNVTRTTNMDRKGEELRKYRFVAHAQHNATRMKNMDRRGRRAWEGSKQHTCRRLERDREPARQRRQWQGPGARASGR